jgi:hypothetical protein
MEAAEVDRVESDSSQREWPIEFGKKFISANLYISISNTAPSFETRQFLKS